MLPFFSICRGDMIQSALDRYKVIFSEKQAFKAFKGAKKKNGAIFLATQTIFLIKFALKIRKSRWISVFRAFFY